ncbi:MAG: NCS2 family permease [Anaerovoracaceae bacterium]|jgi:AGZA family xanthine/uracil permease-like MFS transporter
MEKLFKLKENGTDVRTEIMAGITTFMTMAYILAVNPSVLGTTGMDSAGVFVATALAACIGTLLMSVCANYPFALAPGMGLNAYFAYTVVGAMGYSWKVALAAVLVEGIIFILLTLTNVREAIFNAIPQTLKYAVSCGIGLFIAYIGLQNAKIIVPNENTASALQSFADGTFNTVGVTAILAIIGVVITALFVTKNVKGGILWGILITWLLGIICQLTGLYQIDPANGWYSLLPDFSQGIQIGAISKVAGKISFSGVNGFEFIGVIFAFLFVDMFDTIGTLVGVSTKANMLDDEGKLPHIKGALFADAAATTIGALLGTSTTTTYVESASGVTEGGRTGLTSLTTAILFLVSLVLSPIFLAIPSFATAPALIIVGFYMMGSVTKIDFSDAAESIPAYITILAMPFAYSISDGIFMGCISYVIINMLTGKENRKKISVLMYVLAVIFILKYIFVR